MDFHAILPDGIVYLGTLTVGADGITVLDPAPQLPRPPSADKFASGSAALHNNQTSDT